MLLQGFRAVGVSVLQNGQTSSYQAARKVLLTSGAIGTPRLLQLSGIGPADHLASVGIPEAHDLPGVGENLQDHLDLCVLAACTGPHSYDCVQRWDRSAWAGLQYLQFKTGPVAASLFETDGFWYADPAAAPLIDPNYWSDPHDFDMSLQGLAMARDVLP